MSGTQSPTAPQRLQGILIDESQMTEQIGLLNNPSSSPTRNFTTKRLRMIRNISSLSVTVKRNLVLLFWLGLLKWFLAGAELSPSFEVYNDDEELLLKGKLSGRKSRNQREVLVLTAENENFLKLEFEEDETSQDIKSFTVKIPDQNTVLANIDFDRKATSTCIRDVSENTSYVVKYEANEIAIKTQEGRDLAKILVKTEVTTNMGGFKPTSKSPIFALTFEPGVRPEQKLIFVGYTIAIGVFFSKETRTTLYGGIVFILLILGVCVGIFIYFTNHLQQNQPSASSYLPANASSYDGSGKPWGNHTLSSNSSSGMNLTAS